MLNLKCLNQVVRTESVLQQMLIVREQSMDTGADYKEAIHELLHGARIVTSYNQLTYIVEEVDFDTSAESKFTLKVENEEFRVSYLDYFTQRYRVKITEPS